jgi:hypothetical protein
VEEKLAKVHDYLKAVRYELPQTTTDDPSLFAAVENLTRATTWLLDVVEQILDQQAGAEGAR